MPNIHIGSLGQRRGYCTVPEKYISASTNRPHLGVNTPTSPTKTSDPVWSERVQLFFVASTLFFVTSTMRSTDERRKIFIASRTRARWSENLRCSPSLSACPPEECARCSTTRPQWTKQMSKTLIQQIQHQKSDSRARASPTSVGLTGNASILFHDRLEQNKCDPDCLHRTSTS